MTQLISRAIALVLFAATSVAVAGNHAQKSHSEPANDIVAVAEHAGSFNTLIAALKAASLTETLQGEGPFTVLAPTDAAFAALPEGALDALLADPDALANVLTLHVVAGTAKAADVVTLDKVATLNGLSLAVDTSDGVAIGGANVIQADVAASNGVIHVIDRVILP